MSTIDATSVVISLGVLYYYVATRKGSIMKNLSVIRQLLSLLLVTLVFAGCSATDPVNPLDEGGSSPQKATLSSANASITAEEAEDLVFLREEEKLAHDVYYKMSLLYNKAIFSTITASEQKHMDTVLEVLLHYKLTDPVGENPVGTFVNDEIQGLYFELLAKGSNSYEEALEVGVIIEEKDIEDIELFLTRTTTKKIIQVYENLMNGSNNHLSSFERLQEKL